MATAKKAVPVKKTAAKKVAASPPASDDAWKQKVVDVALRYARRHSWCDVVKQALREADLGDFLPLEYVLQRKWSRSDSWENAVRFTDPSLESDVIARYTELINIRNNEVMRDKLNDLSNKVTDSRVSTAKLREEVEKALVEREKIITNPTVSFPIYRVIKRPEGHRNSSGPHVTVVVEETLPPVKKAATKKTAAKKTAAKKTAARRRAPQVVAVHIN